MTAQSNRKKARPAIDQAALLARAAEDKRDFERQHVKNYIAAANPDNREKIKDCLPQMGFSANYQLERLNDVLDMQESASASLRMERFEVETAENGKTGRAFDGCTDALNNVLGKYLCGDAALADVYCIHPHVASMNISGQLYKIALTRHQFLRPLPCDSTCYYTGSTVRHRGIRKNSHVIGGSAIRSMPRPAKPSDVVRTRIPRALPAIYNRELSYQCNLLR